jgi:septum formation inhibitor-activating ATPase MinD
MRYLILTYYRKPTGQIDEVMAVSKNIKRRDLQTASIILDFKDQKVVLASMGGQPVPRDWDKIVSYYYQHYASTIERLFVENGHKLPQDTAESAPG